MHIHLFSSFNLKKFQVKINWIWTFNAQIITLPSSFLLICMMHLQQLSASYQICINILQHSRSNESWTRHIRDEQKHNVLALQPAAAVGRRGEEKADVFCLTKVWFTFSTSQEVQISAGCNLRHRHTEEQQDWYLYKQRPKPHEEPMWREGHGTWWTSQCRLHHLPCLSPKLRFLPLVQIYDIAGLLCTCQAALLSPKHCVALHPL